MNLSFRRLYSPRKSKKFGFTLVEMLVVIGIIAILAGVLFPAATSAIKAAKRAKAAATINQIQTSVLSYYTEYSVYPVPSGTTTDYVITDGSNSGNAGTDATAWGNLVYALCGNSNPASTFTPSGTGTITNTRSIAFLNLKSSDVYTSGTGLGAPQNPLAISSTTWGATSSYNIAIDSDYDGQLGVASLTGSLMPSFTTSTSGNVVYGGTSSAGVAVWANCTGTLATSTSQANNPSFWVHTY